jgi:hypothetical protein
MNEIPKRGKQKDLRQRAIQVFLIIYFVGYFSLTFGGNYYGPYPPTGQQKFDGDTWIIQHQYIWEPYWTHLDRFGRMNFFGAIYCPLILLDRWLWHHDRFAP